MIFFNISSSGEINPEKKELGSGETTY